MKKSLITIALVFGLSSVASAATLYYTGSDGGWWEVAGNWTTDEGTTASSKPQAGDTVFIGSTDSATNVVVGNNGGSNAFYGLTVNIAEGSTLTITTNDPKIWSSTFTVDSANGLVISGNFWGGYPNAYNMPSQYQHPAEFNLGLNGSVTFEGNFTNSSSAFFNFVGLLNIQETGIISIERRELMSFSSEMDFGNYSCFASVNFDSVEGSATSYVQGEELTATAADLGKYTLVSESGKLYVEYVTGSGAIPEPATASLSLLGLAALAMRRRRA